MLDELVVPKLRRQHGDDSLILAESTGEPGTAALHKTGDRRRRKHTNTIERISGEMIGHPRRSLGVKKA